MDLGAGLSIASGVILLFIIGYKIRELSDLKRVKSLNRVGVVITSNLVWLLLIPGPYWYYFFRGARGDSPPFADSISSPIFTQIPVYLYVLIPMNIFVFLALIKSNLPTKIFIKAAHYSKEMIFWEIFFGFWIAVNTLFMLSFVTDGDHVSICVNLFFLYLLLTLRAGQISKSTTQLAEAHTKGPPLKLSAAALSPCPKPRIT